MITTEEFINRSIKIHGNKYNYSKVEYITDRIKVKIICPEHGVFEQTPNHHSRGVGCPKCVGMNKTTDDIISDFKKTHHDKYDYSLVNYKNVKTKVKIICHSHGVFEQTPNSHLRNHGCPKCSSNKLSKLFLSNNEEFIEKSIDIHNLKYNYSLVDYKGANIKVRIICPNHGKFEQTPSSHLNGNGCPKCGYMKIWSKRKFKNEDFKIKSIKTHGNKYDYSLIEYKNAKTKVKIICPLHGIFEQTPTAHLRGSACPKCGGKMNLNNETFKIKSNKKHTDKYDYSLIDYKNAKTKVKIICPLHGVFEQTPGSHLRGTGCPKCGIESSQHNNIEHSKFVKYNFKEKCKIVHNNKYDYSLVDYINCKLKVKIICPIHGVFEQTPDHHCRGVGCPLCSKTYGGRFEDRYLYILYDEKYNLMKIGISKNPEKRMKYISKGKNSDGLILLKKYKNCALMESKLHKKYDQFRIDHTIYKDGKTEWFKLDKKEIIIIEQFIRYHKLNNF